LYPTTNLSDPRSILSSWQLMSLSTMSNFINQKSSLCPANGRQAVGDGASLTFDNESSVLAVCHLQGTNDMYYYSTTFSGGPGWRF